MIGEGGTHLSANAGKLLVGIGGYDADPRELYQIDEVRAFIRDLTTKVPWWIALLHPTLTLTWVCCLSPKPQIQRKEAGSLMVKIDNEAVEAVLAEAIKRAADRMFELDLGEEDAETCCKTSPSQPMELCRASTPRKPTHSFPRRYETTIGSLATINDYAEAYMSRNSRTVFVSPDSTAARSCPR